MLLNILINAFKFDFLIVLYGEQYDQKVSLNFGKLPSNTTTSIMNLTTYSCWKYTKTAVFG